MRGRQLARTVAAAALAAACLVAASSPATATSPDGVKPDADQIGTIVRNGVPVGVNITTAGQNARFTFSAVSAQKVSLYLSSSTFGTTCGAVLLSLLRPDGSAFGNTIGSCGKTAFLDSQTLDASGNWTVFVDPQGTRTGTASLQAWNTNDATALIRTDGSNFGVSTSKPGQNGRYKFSGTAGQKISAYVTNATFQGCPAFLISLARPDGTRLGTSVSSCGSTAFLDAQTLDATGIWSVIIDPQAMTTGTATLQAYNFSDDTGATDLTGKPAYLKFDQPGQNARRTFAGTAGRRVSAYLTNSTLSPCDVTLSLIRPDGTTLGSPVTTCSSSAFIEPQLLDQTGTWTAVVDPQGIGTGTATLQLFDVVDEALPYAPRSGLKTFTSQVPGRNARYTFSGKVGDTRTVTITGSTYPGCPSLVVSLLRPDGSVLTSTTTCTKTLTIAGASLDAVGTWTLFIDPQGPAMGTMIIRLT